MPLVPREVPDGSETHIDDSGELRKSAKAADDHAASPPSAASWQIMRKMGSAALAFPADAENVFTACRGILSLVDGCPKQEGDEIVIGGEEFEYTLSDSHEGMRSATSLLGRPAEGPFHPPSWPERTWAAIEISRGARTKRS